MNYTLEDIRWAVDKEGLGYFLLHYAHPSHIDRSSSPEADEFAHLWEEILPKLERLQDIATDL